MSIETGRLAGSICRGFDPVFILLSCRKPLATWEQAVSRTADVRPEIHKPSYGYLGKSARNTPMYARAIRLAFQATFGSIGGVPAYFFRSVVCLISLLRIAAADPERIPLWPDKAPNGDGTFSPSTASLMVFQPEHPTGAAMIICPGGGYGGLVTGPEGTGIARWLNQHDITGIVLEYRLPHGNSALPLLDAQRAIRLARLNARAWHLDPHQLGIIGFSAGGHLASTAATHFDAGNAKSEDPVGRFSSRPDFAVLIYPVISMGELGHGGSRKNLLGPNPTPENLAFFSSEKQVTDQTPPTFLAHAKDDKTVSPENSRLFAAALKAHHVPVEYLELPSGGHGLSGYKGPSWDAWQTRSLQWLLAEGGLKPNTHSSSLMIHGIPPRLRRICLVGRRRQQFPGRRTCRSALQHPHPPHRRKTPTLP